MNGFGIGRRVDRGSWIVDRSGKGVILLETQNPRSSCR